MIRSHIVVQPGGLKDFAKEEAQAFVGQKTKDGWTVVEAQWEGPRAISLAIEKE